MILSGCQGKPKNELIIVECPECGEEIEYSALDAIGECDNCGHIIVNEKLECALHCDKAKECIGEETYEKLMEHSDLLAIDPDLIRKLSK